MKILHLSDIHYDINKQAKFNELLNELKNCIKKVDLIFITGDLINRGNAGTDSSDKGFEIFDKEFICPLLEHFKIKRSSIILSPGNHDIDRTKVNQISEYGLQTLLLDEEKVSEIINRGITYNSYQEYDRIKSYKNYVKNFYQNSDNSKITLFHDTHIFSIEGIHLGITSFNTAWRCFSSKSDQEKLILGLQQCLLAAEEVKNYDIKIGLMHHELSFLQKSDYEKILPRLKKNYDILCFGHTHTGNSFKHYSTNGEVINLTSPGFCTENMFTENDKYNVGFSIINIEKVNGIVDVVYYKWSQINTEFNINPELRIDIPLKIKSLITKNNIYSTESIIIERNCEGENNKFKNDTINGNINEIKSYQDNIILTKVKGVLYSNIHEIKKILEKIDEYNFFSNDLDFALLYADKIINSDKIIYSKFENYFINNIICTDKVIVNDIMEEIMIFLEEWLITLYKVCINMESDDILKIIEDSYFIDKNKFGINIIIQLLKDKKNIEKFVDEYSEKKKKEVIVASFILPIIYINKSNIKYYKNESEHEENDTNNYYIDREIDENIYNSFSKFAITILYGKIGIGKTSSIKKISKIFSDYNEINICLYFSLSYQSLQENIKSFIELCNNRLIINISYSYINDMNTDEMYTNIFNKIFENLIIEYKNVYIVIDNIDNTNMGILNLIINIKSDCHFIFIINEKVLQLNYDNQNIKYIQYPDFTISDIKKFTNIDDEIAVSLSHFDVDFKVINDINNKCIDINSYIHERKCNINSSYLLKANKWLCISPNYEEEILILLSLFSKVCPINIEHIQNYLLQLSIYIKKPYIMQILFENEDQIVHNDYSKIKLKDEDFVNYLCTDYFSQYDIEIALKRIYEWIGNLDKLNSPLIAYVLVNMDNIYGGSPELINELQQNLNRTLFDRGNSELLFSIGQTIYNEFKEHKEKAISYLEKASDNNYLKATEFLIKYYLEQSKNYNKAKNLILQALKFDSEKAKFYYIFGVIEEKFIDEDDTYDRIMELSYELSLFAIDPFIKKRSMLIYCINTIKGFNSKITYDKALENIKLLAEEDSISKLYYAKNLINSDEEIYIKEAEAILQSLSKDGLVPAKIELAKLYMSELFEYKKAIEIIKTIEDVNLKEIDGIILDVFYDDKLIDDDYLYISSYINNKLEKNDEEFIISYALVLLYGNRKYRNINEGKKYLENFAEKGIKNAIYLLGSYLVDYEPNNINGILLLEKASLLNSISAQLKLAKMYLNTKSSYFDHNKGINLYHKLINKGHIDAILEYNKYIIQNAFFTENEIIDAESKLISLAEMGNINAVKILAEIYLDKNSGTYNEYKGEYYLTIAVRKGDLRSICTLSQKYLYGLGLKVNLEKAVELLMIGINKNDAFCMAILGKAIIENTVFYINENKGKELLLKGYELNNYFAKLYYGYLLCIGNCFEQNKILGEKLLYEASEIYDEAKLMLSRMKLDGKYLKIDKEEGLKLLKNAVDNDFEEAKIEYAERLIDGDQIEADEIKGLSILRQLINSNSDNAKIVYAQKLLTQKFGEKEKEARNILTELLGNSKKAKRLYAINLLDKKLEYDLIKEKREEKTICLLQENILENDKLSMYILGDYYIEGDKITRNITKGIEIFELGVSKENTECMRNLGDILIRGELVDRNINRGINLLYTACQRGDLEARFIYAKYNIEGSFIETPDMINGWRLMEQLVEDNYTDAKLYMANACIKGSYREVNIEYGINIFEELIKVKNETACINYSNILSSEQYIKASLKKSQNVLQIALNKPEAYRAKYEKIQRMYSGRWKNNSIKKAAREIETLANSGSEKARFELAIRQITGNGMAKNEKQGNETLKNIYKDISTLSAFPYGMVAYRLKVYDVASNMFDIAIRSETFDCRNALAYIIRRKQYTGDLTKYNVPDLLRPLCDVQYPIALMNLALYLVEGTNDDTRWREADELVKKIKYYDDCFEWWYDLMVQGDDEGKLVIAWLIRNNTYTNKNDLHYDILVKNIDKKIWNIPSWIFND